MFSRTRQSSFALTLGVALLAATAIPQLRASDFDKKTIMSFDSPIEISGKILPAGTYVLTSFGDNRNIVRVMDRDESHVYATVLAIPIETLNTPGNARIEVFERPGNAPEVVHAWFYPGENMGWEFPSPQGEK
jgi:hypothetical protein